MAEEHVKRYSTLLVAGRCKLKPRAYPYCDWMQRYISQATFRGLVSPLYVSPWAVLANLGHSSFSAPSGVSGGSPSPSVCTCFLSDNRCRSQGHVLVNILHANSISESVSRRTASVTATHPLEWLRYLEKKIILFFTFWNINWRQLQTYIASWFLAKVQRQFNGERIIISTNIDGTARKQETVKNLDYLYLTTYAKINSEIDHRPKSKT